MRPTRPPTISGASAPCPRRKRQKESAGKLAMQTEAGGNFFSPSKFKKFQRVGGIEINQADKIHFKLFKVSEVVTQFQIELYQFEGECFRTKIFLNRIPTSEHFTVLCQCAMDFEPT
jgi:hypothetical protein